MSRYKPDATGRRLPMWDIRTYESIDSTNLEAQRLLADGACPGLVVVARHQTGGRGRMGRSWLDLPGKSLLVSLVLGEVEGFASSVLVAISARAAIVALGGGGPHFKWPNDLVYGGRKAGGILSEAYAAGDKTHTIIGLGLNAGYLPDELDIPARLPATSLLIEEGKIWNIPELLSELLRQLESRWERGREGWMGEYRENLAFVGEVVRVDPPCAVLGEQGRREEGVEGKMLGVDDDGNAVLEVAGETIRLASGDMHCG